ncbi:MAG: pyridoxamine 5'-phosphate oxidase, partial [Bacteroidia bacterium]|nr:pyridoxamine 5'-phosphate oxidase [Bacteroidia bacterium]
STRIVLLRGYNEEGLVFYTNYNSDKAVELLAQPKTELNFFWPQLQRQMRIRGTISKVDTKTSDEYFATRPRASQISAWASNQSSQIDSRSELEQNMQSYLKKFEGKDVPRPENWGGLRLTPNRFEFWQGRLSRLHDRLVYTLQDDKSWEVKRLSP